MESAVDVCSWATGTLAGCIAPRAGTIRRAARRRDAGFTLIEMATALIIVAVVAAIGMGLSGMKRRGNFASATGDLIVGLRKTRAWAFGRGTTTVFVIDTVGARFWGIEDVNGAFDLSTFNRANPAPAGYNLLTSGTLPTGVSFTGAINGYGSALPQPYAGIPSFSGSTATPNFNYCSFCRTTNPNAGFGSIQLYPGGGARFNAGPTAVGQSFTVIGESLGSNGSQARMTFAVIGRTGAAESFESL
jgi:prepilin-type N-terminal cleavage/methylation domain-containing protein